MDFDEICNNKRSTCICLIYNYYCCCLLKWNNNDHEKNEEKNKLFIRNLRKSYNKMLNIFVKNLYENFTSIILTRKFFFIAQWAISMCKRPISSNFLYIKKKRLCAALSRRSLTKYVEKIPKNEVKLLTSSRWYFLTVYHLLCIVFHTNPCHNPSHNLIRHYFLNKVQFTQNTSYF